MVFRELFNPVGWGEKLELPVQELRWGCGGFFLVMSSLEHLSHEEVESWGFTDRLPRERSGQEFT